MQKSGVAGLVVMISLASPVSATAPGGLCLWSFPEPELVQHIAAPDGTGFGLSFIHSVSGTPVLDEYELTGRTITQRAEIFEAHGAGLPSAGDEFQAEGWRHEDGKFILDLNRAFDEMILRIQPEYENTLHINGESIRLAALGEAVLRVTACASREEK